MIRLISKILAAVIILSFSIVWLADQQPVFKAADDRQQIYYKFYKTDKKTPWLPKVPGQDEVARYLAPFVLVLLIVAARRNTRDTNTVFPSVVGKTFPNGIAFQRKSKFEFLPYYLSACIFCSAVILFFKAAMSFHDTFIFCKWWFPVHGWSQMEPLVVKSYLLWTTMLTIDSGMTYVAAGTLVGCLVAGSFEFAARKSERFKINNVSMLSFASYSAAFFGWMLITSPVSASLLQFLPR